MIQWITEYLLKREINKLSIKDNLDEQEHFLLTQCQKELEILYRLKVERIDTTGSVEEVEARLKGNSVYFLDKSDFDRMNQKAMLFDIIKDIVNS